MSSCSISDNPTTCTNLTDCNNNRFGNVSTTTSPGSWSYSCVQCGATVIYHNWGLKGSNLKQIENSSTFDCTKELFDYQNTNRDGKSYTASFDTKSNKCYIQSMDEPGHEPQYYWNYIQTVFSVNPIPDVCTTTCSCTPNKTTANGENVKQIENSTKEFCCTSLKSDGSELGADMALLDPNTKICYLQKNAVDAGAGFFTLIKPLPL